MRSNRRQSIRARTRALGAAGCLALALVAAAAPSAPAAAPSRIVRYRGVRISVPPGWPVYDLGRDPTVCVRFDRHAVYLGRPGSRQHCPAHAVGQTEAILIEPAAAGGARPSHVLVRATWNRHRELIRRALGGAPGFALSGAATAARASRGRPPLQARSASLPTNPGGVYTGLGFDSCSAPSSAQMSAWSGSKYHAVGVYIGGTNMACAQPNLTAGWVSEESAAGWHVIPTYVGLQAPTNSCGCSAIAPGRAAAQGAAAADDAIARAQALGLGAGNPLYFDMEAYPTGGTNSAAVLKFLSSWTVELHHAGYRSGVYSSADSGISDLVGAVGSTSPSPDDIWIADWNGRRTTSASNVPAGDWPSHQRIHQYQGGHDETYGAVTINIDGNYLDADTASPGPAAAATPSLTVSPAGDGTIRLKASWPGAAGVSAWRLLAGTSPATLAPLSTPTPGVQAAMVVHSAYPYFSAQALDAGGQVLAGTQIVATPPRIAIYGPSAFVPPGGLGGLPVGCFTGAPCHVITTISAGGVLIARTGSEFVPAGGGIVHFKLLPAGRAMLSSAAGRRLAVRILARDLSGESATVALKLIPFSTAGSGPHTSLTQAPSLAIIGATDFVSRTGVGGVLAACLQPTPCLVNTRLTAHGTEIAAGIGEFLGANELGYLSSTLTGRGRAMLARARGNQLAARVTIFNGSAIASGQLRLVGFS